MNLIELARQHIQAENDHDVPATMATISENGADYKIWSNNESFASRQTIEDF